MIELKKSPVTFIEDIQNDVHKYILGEKELSGITPIISWLYPDTYFGIDEETMRIARNRGTRIHHLCQAWDECSSPSDEQQVQDYIELTKPYNHLASEYLVSDEMNFASAIDKVYQGKDGVVLGDIKCTSSLHERNVTIQLSIYAMLFERMNPNVKVEKLIAIWLPLPKYGNARIVECKRIPAYLCDEILDAFLNSPFIVASLREKISNVTLPSLPQRTIEKFNNFGIALAKIGRLKAKLNDAEEKMRAQILDDMQQYDIKMWENEGVRYTRKLASKRQTLDSKKVKEHYPDVYFDCINETETKESLLIKEK